MIDPDTDYYRIHAAPDSPIQASTGFDYDAVEEHEQPLDAKSTARFREQLGDAVDAILDWMFVDIIRKRHNSIRYRVYAAAWVVRRGIFENATLSDVAKEAKLHRIVLHRHVEDFSRRFRTRRPSSGKRKRK